MPDPDQQAPPTWRGPYSTVLIPSGMCTRHMVFRHRLGDFLPGSITPRRATHTDTNMETSGRLVYDAEFTGLETSIPACPGVWRSTPVTPGEVDEFIGKSTVALFVCLRQFLVYAPCGVPLVKTESGWIQQVVFPKPLRLSRNDDFHVEIETRDPPPRFSEPLPVIVRMIPAGEDPRIAHQYGTWTGARDKAYVVVGKEGLDELLAELLGVDDLKEKR